MPTECRLNKRQLNAVIDNMTNGVAVFFRLSDSYPLSYANREFYRLHHRNRKVWPLEFCNLLDWIYPDDRQVLESELRNVCENGKKHGKTLYRTMGEDGTLYLIDMRFHLSYTSGGVRYYCALFADAGEYKKLERELAVLRQMYDYAVRAARLYDWIYDGKNHRITMQSEFSQKLCEELGLPKVTDNVANSLLKYIYPDDRSVLLDFYDAIDAGKSFGKCEVKVNLPFFKSQHIVQISFHRINDKNGESIAVYCYGQDITKQKIETEKYHQFYQQLEQAYPRTFGSFYINLTTNLCGKGRSSFKFAQKLFKAETADAFFAEFSKLINEETIRKDFDRRFSRKMLLRAFAQGTTEISIEYPVVSDDGVKRWRKGILLMLKNPMTEDVEAVLHTIDNNDKKNYELIIKKLINDNFDYIGVLHPQDKTFEFKYRKEWVDYGQLNKRLAYDKCCRYIHNLIQEPEERSHFDKIASIENITADLWKNAVRRTSYTRRIDDATIKCSQLQYCWLEQPGGDILVVRSDVTATYLRERKRIAALEAAKREVERANAAKSDFLARMSHDMRTPLNGILGMTYITQKMNLPKKANENIEKINTSAQFLLGLINDLLDVSKAESGKIELHPEPYPVAELINYVNAVMRPLCDNKKQRLDISITSVDGYVCLMDKLRTNQIFLNLISNAVKYTPENGNISLSLCEHLTKNNKIAMRAVIADDGIGMSNDFQKVMFDSFTQEERHHNAEMQGAGLGLAIVKRLIEYMGGTICVKSAPNKGTTFTIDIQYDCIPVAEASYNNVEPVGKLLDVNILAGKHILLCEDHPLNQEIAKLLLEEKKIIVEVADNGKSGVETFSNSVSGYFDAVLMDIRMPVMDGYEATKRIRALDRSDAGSVPIVAMTANAYNEDILQCFEAGMNDHLSKPVDPDMLIDKLCKMLK